MIVHNGSDYDESVKDAGRKIPASFTLLFVYIFWTAVKEMGPIVGNHAEQNILYGYLIFLCAGYMK